MNIFAWLLVFGFFAIGIALVIGGIQSLTKRISRRKFMRRATGKIISLESKYVTTSSTPRTGSSRHPFYFPVIEYTTESGHKRSFKSSSGVGDPAKYVVGNPIEVIYDYENPEDENINDKFSLYFLPLSLTLAGLLSIAASGFVLRMLLKQ